MNCLHGLAALIISSMLAGAVQPDWKEQLSSPKLGNHPRLPAGTLEFEISWKGILRSGELQMKYGACGAHKPNVRVAQFSAKSLGLAAAIFPYKGSSWSELMTDSSRPRLFESWERTKDETVTTSTQYLKDRVICREITQPHGKKTKQVEEHEFSHTPIFDISSALLHIRSQKLNNGDQISLLLHPFNKPYLLQAKVLGREIHDGCKSIRLSVEMRKIDSETLELKPYKKLKKAAILWLSDDAERLPTELRAKVFVGDIRATLVAFRKP